MLTDIDLKYRGKSLATSKSLIIDGDLTVGGTFSGGLGNTDPNIALPADQNLVAWTYDPVSATASSITVNGTLYLMKVWLRRTATVTKVWWIQSTAGATPTSGQNFAALYKADGTLLSSIGIDALVTASNGAQNATLAVAQTNLAAGGYYVGLLWNATTPPTLGRAAGLFTSSNNLGLTAANYRFATNGTTQTALPSPFTPSANALGSAYWAGVS